MHPLSAFLCGSTPRPGTGGGAFRTGEVGRGWVLSSVHAQSWGSRSGRNGTAAQPARCLSKPAEGKKREGTGKPQTEGRRENADAWGPPCLRTCARAYRAPSHSASVPVRERTFNSGATLGLFPRCLSFFFCEMGLTSVPMYSSLPHSRCSGMFVFITRLVARPLPSSVTDPSF